MVDGLQFMPKAGAGNTQTRLDHKLCTMIGALDRGAAAIEKLVFLPFQRNSQMGAGIAIHKNLSSLLDGKDIQVVLLKAPARAFGKIIQLTQGNQLFVAFGHCGAIKRTLRVSSLPSRITLTFTLSPGL